MAEWSETTMVSHEDVFVFREENQHSVSPVLRVSIVLYVQNPAATLAQDAWCSKRDLLK